MDVDDQGVERDKLGSVWMGYIADEGLLVLFYRCCCVPEEFQGLCERVIRYRKVVDEGGEC